jgi:hypothetical protein
MWSLFCATLFAATPTANAEPAAHRLYTESIAGLRYNPIGLQVRSTLYSRHRLMDKPEDDLLFGDTWVGIGPTFAASPAFIRGGIEARLVPIALLRLTGRWEGVGYFGSFDQLLSWSATEVPIDTSNSATVCDSDPVVCAPVDYSEGAMEALGTQGQTYPTRGWQSMGEARLQAKAGPIAVRNTLGAFFTKIDLRDGDTVFYDQTFDILMANEGWTLVNDADLLFVGVDQWTIGVRHSAVHAIHGDDSDADQWTHRAGPIIARAFKGSRTFRKPTVYALPQWWLKHNYRTGAESSQAIPQIIIGLGWTGDLLPKGG